MPEKKSVIGSLLDEYLPQILSGMLAGAQKKAKRYVTSLILETSALVILFYGAGSLLGSFFPEWRPGLSHILVALVVMVIVAYVGKER